MLILPAIIVGGYIFANLLNWKLGDQIALLSVTTILTLLFSLKDFLVDDPSYVEKRKLSLRCMSVLSQGLCLIAYLASTNNQNKNSFDLTLWIICTAIVVLSILLLFISENVREWSSGRSSYIYYSAISKLLSLTTVVMLTSFVYVNFGTQYIWVPTSFLSLFLIAFFQTPAIQDYQREFNEHHGRTTNKAFDLLVILPIVTSLISTFYQFWFYKGAFGYMLHEYFTLIGFLTIVWYVFKFSKSKVRALKAKKKDRENVVLRKANEELEKQERELNQKQENLKKEEEEAKKRKKLQDACGRILNHAVPDWYDILLVAEYYKEGIFPKELIGKIHKAPLSQLITVSTVKKHLVWESDFGSALALLSRIIDISFDDNLLIKLLAQIDDFMVFIRNYEKFTGYGKLTIQVKTHMETIKKSIKK